MEDYRRPSYFEMIAQDRLIISLKPVLTHMFHALGRRSSLFARIARYDDEIFYALMFALERHCLDQYDASFAENFYGLRRVVVMDSPVSSSSVPSASSSLTLPNTLSSPISATQHVARPGTAAAAASGGPLLMTPTTTLQQQSPVAIRSLKEMDRRRGLFFLVVLPYIKQKLDVYYERLTGANVSDDNDGFEAMPDMLLGDPMTRIGRARRSFVRIYPYFNALYEGCLFMYQLRYLFEFTRYYSPWLQSIRQTMQRVSMHEMMELANKNRGRTFDRVWESTARMGLLRKMRYLISRFGYWCADYSKWGILFGVFAFKFAEWWYSAENRLAPSSRVTVIPPPPEPSKRAASGMTLPADRTICGICSRSRTNPATTPSGFVFCYPCLFHYISEHHKCPVTLLPCHTDQIRKIYEG